LAADEVDGGGDCRQPLLSPTNELPPLSVEETIVWQNPTTEP